VSAEGAGEIATETLLTSVVGEFAAVPLLENEVVVASVVVRIVDDEPVEAGMPLPAAAPVAAHNEPPDAPAPPPLPPLAHLPAPAPEPPPVGAGVPVASAPPTVGLAMHEFQPLADGRPLDGPLRPIALLNDVNMEITAELGRGRLRVRDIVGLRPGTVIELDRAAGSPVDVLVNGALVWHGEVVVVDDEFGIRVSEIVTDEN
jgi:flagellar motor switch protein FliN